MQQAEEVFSRRHRGETVIWNGADTVVLREAARFEVITAGRTVAKLEFPFCKGASACLVGQELWILDRHFVLNRIGFDGRVLARHVLLASALPLPHSLVLKHCLFEENLPVITGSVDDVNVVTVVLVRGPGDTYRLGNMHVHTPGPRWVRPALLDACTSVTWGPRPCVRYYETMDWTSVVRENMTVRGVSRQFRWVVRERSRAKMLGGKAAALTAQYAEQDSVVFAGSFQDLLMCTCDVVVGLPRGTLQRMVHDVARGWLLISDHASVTVARFPFWSAARQNWVTACIVLLRI